MQIQAIHTSKDIVLRLNVEPLFRNPDNSHLSCVLLMTTRKALLVCLLCLVWYVRMLPHFAGSSVRGLRRCGRTRVDLTVLPLNYWLAYMDA